MDDNLTPAPKPKAITMDFPDAMRLLINGKKIARIEWANDDYCFLDKKEGSLSIYREGKQYTWWKVNDGDLEAQDWFVVGTLDAIEGEVVND